MMEQLSQQEEMQANEYLAKELIESRLDVLPSPENIRALANFIFQLEHPAKYS